MIFGNPDQFAISFDIVEEWNDDPCLWNNGVLFIYIDGRIIPQTLNTFELRTTLSAFNAIEADMFYGNKIELPKNDLIKMVRSYAVGGDEHFDTNYFLELLNRRIIWELSGATLADQRYFIFVIKDSVSEYIVWSDPQGGFYEKILPIGTVGLIAKKIYNKINGGKEAEMEWVWVFHGDGGRSCSAIFSDRSKAEIYIKKYLLSGLLEKMPIDKSIYDWAIESGYFEPKKDYQSSSVFIQQFSSAYLEHYHYNNGEPR